MVDFIQYDHNLAINFSLQWFYLIPPNHGFIWYQKPCFCVIIITMVLSHNSWFCFILITMVLAGSNKHVVCLVLITMLFIWY